MSAMPAVVPELLTEDEPPPPPSRSNSRVDPRAGNPSSPADMNWEAPPGEMPQQRRTGTRAGVVNKRTESSTQPMGDVPEVEEWEAPPATEVPRRRTSNEAPRRTNVGSTSVARMPSRQDVTRASIEAPAPRRGTESSALRRSGIRPGEPPADEDAPQPRLS